MTLSELLEQHSIFHSLIWYDVITELRDFIDIDPQGSSPTPINTVDEYIKAEYGDCEVLPMYYTIVDGEETVKEQEVTSYIDAVIGANIPYWTRLLQSLLAEFDPLYNVDAHETTTTVFGEHETTDAKAARTHTDTLAPTQETRQFGAQSMTSGARSDSSTDGAQEITQKETTMDDTATFKNKSQETHAAISNSFSKGSQTDTTLAHTDTVSTIQVQNTANDAAATDTLTSKTHTDTVTVRRYGNIGVTMSTQLLRDFQLFARESRLVNIIAETLARSLALLIWY